MFYNANDILQSQIMSFNQILYIQWHITDQCEENCKHCYQSAWDVPLSVDDNKEIIKRIKEYSVYVHKEAFIAFTGGDPLLYSGIWELCDCCRENGINILFKGNPHKIFQPEVVERLINYEVLSYQMSIDGLQESHDSLRSKGSFAKTIQAFDILNKAKITTVAKCTISKNNIKQIMELAQFIDSKSIDFFGVGRLICVSHALEHNLPMVSAIEYHKLMDMLFYYEFKETSLIFYDPIWVPFFYEKGLLDHGLLEKIKRSETVMSGCPIWEDSFCINSQGNVLACSRIPDSVIGNLLQSSLEDIYKNNRLCQIRNISTIEGCNVCDLQNACRGCRASDSIMSENQFLKGKIDPYCILGPIQYK